MPNATNSRDNYREGRSVRSRDAGAGYASERWARIVVQVIGFEEDPKTLRSWARQAGVSAGTIRGWCRVAGVSAKQSLRFARLLRVIVRRKGSRVAAFDVLDIVDARTMLRLLRDGGIGAEGTDAWPSVDEFLPRQTFVRDTNCLTLVESLCGERL